MARQTTLNAAKARVSRGLAAPGAARTRAGLCGLSLGLAILAGGGAGGVAGSVAQAQAQEEPAVLTIDAATCRTLVRHSPDPDVSYRPGVDVHGRPVAPADLHDYSAFESLVPDTVTFHVVLDPFEGTGVATPRGIESPGMALGTVAYDITRGAFRVNGVPITTGQEEALRRACHRGLSGRTAPGGVIYPPGYDGPRLPDRKPVP